MKTEFSQTESKPAGSDGEAWIEVLNTYMQDIKFGVIQITVHDGKVVQVERTEKVRFQQPKIPPQAERKDVA
jgi:hypothetical protein